MWEEQKRARLQQLRQAQDDRKLTDTEQAELDLLIQELEANEAAYLTFATERLRQEREALEKQNAALEGLARRKSALVKKLQSFLAEAQAERQAIDGELAAVLAGSHGPTMDE